MADHSAIVLESQLDWLTVSYRGADKARALRNFAIDVQGMEAKDGNDTHKWSLNGYVGYRCGRVRYGDRDNACLVQLSGQLAEDWAGTIAPDATTITRCDMAVTVLPTPPLPTYGSEALAELVAWRQMHPLAALPSHVWNANGGETVYLGGRRSPLFFRLYNKGQEAAERDDAEGVERYQNAWRYELECHDVAAKAVALAAVESRNRAAYVSGYMLDYLLAHGHSPLFRETSKPVHRDGFRRRSDYQSRLRWFASDVAPAIRTAMGQGDPAEVLHALGFDVKGDDSLTKP